MSGRVWGLTPDVVRWDMAPLSLQAMEFVPKV